MKQKLIRIGLIIIILCSIVTLTGCGTEYKTLAQGFYDTSVGLNKAESINEQLYGSKIIDKTTSTNINEGIIKALGLKKTANDLMGTIDPNNITADNRTQILNLGNQLSQDLEDTQTQVNLGVKDPNSQASLNAVLSTIRASIATVIAVGNATKKG